MTLSSSCVALTLPRRGIDERVASTSSGVKLWERMGGQWLSSVVGEERERERGEGE